MVYIIFVNCSGGINYNSGKTDKPYFFWPLGTWLISYIAFTCVSVITNKRVNRITLIYCPLLFTVLFMIMWSLATGNNYFSIWIYEPALDTYRKFHLLN